MILIIDIFLNIYMRVNANLRLGLLKRNPELVSWFE